MSDWEAVTKIGSKARGGASAPKAKVVRSESELAAAKRTGQAVDTSKKVSGSGTYQQVAKIDYTDDIIKPKTVGTQVGDAIKKARSEAKNDKGQAMTQKDLAQKINQTPQIVADFERGSAKPDEQILGNIERVLKVILRGKNIGQPKTYGKKNAAT